MANEVQLTKVITGKVRFSYLHAFEPQEDDKGSKKYGVSLIIPKSDTVTIAAIKKAVNAALEAGMSLLGIKHGQPLPSSLKLPLRDGDIDKPGDEAYENSFFVNAGSKGKPGLVKQVGVKDGKPLLKEITDPDELYSGCYGKASVTFYAYNKEGGKGIACGLNNLLKLEDGENLGGRQPADTDFGGVMSGEQTDESWM